MYIIKSIYEQILNSMPISPPEIGGILGSVNNVICNYYIDAGCAVGCGCFYSPNVHVLNEVIKKWRNDDIIF